MAFVLLHQPAMRWSCPPRFASLPEVYNPRTGILEGPRAIDWVGSLVVIGATLMFLLGLQFGGITHPWDSATVVCLIVFSVIVFVVFFVIE